MAGLWSFPAARLPGDTEACVLRELQEESA
jgi:8-oxo-dGTP pyrophosphatase MutT (NUDIX family)